MTTRPPSFGEGDPDAATNGLHGVNEHLDENVQPPWPPATRPDSRPPPAGTADHNGHGRHVPLGDLDEQRRSRPPATPSPARVSRPLPPAMRPAGHPPGVRPGVRPADRNGRADYTPPAELDEPRRSNPPVGPPSERAPHPRPSNARITHKGGRHKQPRATQPLPPPLADADGYNLRPNPLGATTVADLMECVRQYHIWAGNRGLRVMARHIEQQLSPQTLSNLMRSSQLPRLGDQMQLLIEACGGDAEDQQRFVTAWRRFKMGH